MKSTILMAIILALVPTSLASAQFVLDSLPKPGQWARYDQSITYPQKPDEKSEWWLEIRCLPDDSNEGMECVWIEIEQSRSAGRSVIYELLIPQSEFRPGGEPLKNLVKGWISTPKANQNDNSLPPSRTNRKNVRMLEGDVNMVNSYYIVSPPEDAEQLMSDHFEVNMQTFQCKGLGFALRTTESRHEHIFQFDTYASPEAPFGLVSANCNYSVLNGTKEFAVTNESTILVNWGDDAVSAIPDVK